MSVNDFITIYFSRKRKQPKQVAFIIYTMQTKQYNMYSILQKVLVLSGENVK